MTTIVIPARLKSERLKEKAIEDIDGLTLIQRVVKQCLKTPFSVTLVTDSLKIADSICPRNVNILCFDENASSGTERIANAIEMIPGNDIINVQGDQPFIDPGAIIEMAEVMEQMQEYQVITPYKYYDRRSDYGINCSKSNVVTSQSGRVMYFSRYPLGTDRLKIHMGIYGYRRKFLENFHTLKTSRLEEDERLEQIRFLDNDIPVYAYETKYDVFSVDVPEDLEHARKIAWECD